MQVRIYGVPLLPPHLYEQVTILVIQQGAWIFIPWALLGHRLL